VSAFSTISKHQFVARVGVVDIRAFRADQQPFLGRHHFDTPAVGISQRETARVVDTSRVFDCAKTTEVAMTEVTKRKSRSAVLTARGEVVRFLL
jgi:hypothetical protein